jgi:hypothetical protein
VDFRELNKPNIMIFWVKTLILKNWLPKKECLKARIIVISFLKSSFIKIGKLTIEPLSMDVDVQLPETFTVRVVIVDDVKEFLQVLKQLM